MSKASHTPGPVERLERAVWDTRVSPSKSDIAQILNANNVMREALESIAEYWNRDRNDSAMHDACWHAINTAEEALGDAGASGSQRPDVTELLEALGRITTVDMGGGFLGAQACREVARAAIAKAEGRHDV